MTLKAFLARAASTVGKTPAGLNDNEKKYYPTEDLEIRFAENGGIYTLHAIGNPDATEFPVGWEGSQYVYLPANDNTNVDPRPPGHDYHDRERIFGQNNVNTEDFYTWFFMDDEMPGRAKCVTRNVVTALEKNGGFTLDPKP